MYIPIVRQSRPLIYSYNTECCFEAYGSMHNLVEENKDKSLFSLESKACNRVSLMPSDAVSVGPSS